MASSLVFKSRRSEPVLVAPAEPTPHEFKALSDLDDQKGLCAFAPSVHFYRSCPSMAGRDPAEVVRAALAKVLVYYYPLAGRMREGPGGKLLVECTGEGAQFVEADADVELAQFGPGPQPPFPCLEELIYGGDGSAGGFLDSPPLSIQVTRLRCGGFVFGLRINHAITDGYGLAMVLSAMSEIALGAAAPSLPPVWERERLMARDPPRVTHLHPAYDKVAPEKTIAEDLVFQMFFFGPRELSALRRRLPPQQQACTRFELITAALWRSRAIAIGGDADDEFRLRINVNARGKCTPPLPAGYYGNTPAYPVARATLGELSRNPVGYALELVREAKASVTEGYLQSNADFLVLHGRPKITLERTFLVSDVSRMGFDEVDFGWGRAAFAGPAVGGGRVPSRLRSHYIRSINGKGEEGVLIPMASAMERFKVEIERLVVEQEPAALVCDAA